MTTGAEALGVDAIYADDVVYGAGEAELRLKPAFDPLLLESTDYIGGAALFRADALDETDRAALAAGRSPASIIRRRPDLRIAHLPYPAFLSPRSEGALIPQVRNKCASVSVVIPNRDNFALIRVAVEGLLEKTSAQVAEIVIVDNGSTAPEVLAYYDQLRENARIRIDIDPQPFNFAAMVNRGAALANGEAILLLNNDIEVVQAAWLDRMIETLGAPGVGVVGAKLLFPDRTIQHAGVLVGHGGVAGHDMKGMARDTIDPLGRMAAPHLRSAVTAAAMLIRRSTWDDLGGFDEEAFAVAFNDVDFCLRAGARGWRVALDPRAVLIHHESVSRKRGVSLRRTLQHQRERRALRRRHGTVGYDDPFESPWRDLDILRPNFRMLQTPPPARLSPAISEAAVRRARSQS
ncbi:MAG: glycosyltransferase family 2 protein [Pseudomonadota bacterium]